MPPPSPASLSMNVQALSVGAPPSQNMPPPCVASCPEIVHLVRIAAEEMHEYPPPKPPIASTL